MDRYELIALCKMARVPYKKWRNRDSHSAQANVMMAGLLLESGCEFNIRTEPGNWCTDESTIWVEIFYDNWEDGEQWHTHYIPTAKRLTEANGEDWY